VSGKKDLIVKVIGGHGGVSPGFQATSYLINDELLIDAGSIASGVTIKEQVAVENILISHAHLDHISELAYLCDNCFGLRPSPFMVHSNKVVKDAILTHILNDTIWPDFSKLPSESKPTIKFNEFIPGKSFVLGDYEIMPVRVNHYTEACGFIITWNNKSLIFTQDTGPTEEIWKAGNRTDLVGIFSEVSFPNSLEQVAIDSLHHTPKSIGVEIKKMPPNVPIYLGHLKPNYQDKLVNEIAGLGENRINLLTKDGVVLKF
jgi:ribonuclease BN (tRNA processing enzyme)